MSRPSGSSMPRFSRLSALSRVVPCGDPSPENSRSALHKHKSGQKSPFRMLRLRASFHANPFLSQRSANVRMAHPNTSKSAPIPAPPVNPIESYSFADIPSKPFRVYLFHKQGGGGGWSTPFLPPSSPHRLVCGFIPSGTASVRPVARRRCRSTRDMVAAALRAPPP